MSDCTALFLGLRPLFPFPLGRWSHPQVKLSSLFKKKKSIRWEHAAFCMGMYVCLCSGACIMLVWRIRGHPSIHGRSLLKVGVVRKGIDILLDHFVAELVLLLGSGRGRGREKQPHQSEWLAWSFAETFIHNQRSRDSQNHTAIVWDWCILSVLSSPFLHLGATGEQTLYMEKNTNSPKIPTLFPVLVGKIQPLQSAAGSLNVR